MFPAAPLMLAKRNERAISNYCKDGKLQAKMMLIFRHMPNCQHESGEALCEHEVARVDWRNLDADEDLVRAGSVGRGNVDILKTLDRVAISRELNSAHIDISFVRAAFSARAGLRDSRCRTL